MCCLTRYLFKYHWIGGFLLSHARKLHKLQIGSLSIVRKERVYRSEWTTNNIGVRAKPFRMVAKSSALNGN